MSESVSAETSGASGWVSAAEAGQLCHVSERTVRRWVASGRLPADASGPTLRLAVTDLQPYFAAAVDTLPDEGQPPRAPAGQLTVLRPEPTGPALDGQVDGAADRPHADAPCPDDTSDTAIPRPDDTPHANISHHDDTPETHAQLVATLEACIADLRQRLDHAEAAQAELRRLLALALKERALPEPSAEDLHNHTSASPRPWWERWLAWRR
jgi:excisionase family DNA binding protein